MLNISDGSLLTYVILIHEMQLCHADIHGFVNGSDWYAVQCLADVINLTMRAYTNCNSLMVLICHHKT